MFLMENGSLMEVKNIAECSHWSILQYFWPQLSDNLYLKTNFGVIFEWPLKTFFNVCNRCSTQMKYSGRKNDRIRLTVLSISVLASMILVI